MVGLTDRLDMTIAVDWDVKPQNNNKLLRGRKKASSSHGTSCSKYILPHGQPIT